MSHPLLLSIDGIDGSGKSSQVSRVSAALSNSGVRSKPMVVEAFGARTVNSLAAAMTGDPYAYHPIIPAELREWVFACDVAYFTKVRFEPLFDEGVTIVWDRGPLSYQASAAVYNGLSTWVQRAQSLYPRPYRTYLLDVPVDVAVDRIRKRTGKSQRADENVELLDQIAARMRQIADSRSDIIIVDATRSPDDVTKFIVANWLAR